MSRFKSVEPSRCALCKEVLSRSPFRTLDNNTYCSKTCFFKAGLGEVKKSDNKEYRGPKSGPTLGPTLEPRA